MMATVTSPREIEQIFSQGSRVKTPLFMMLIHDTPDGRDPMGRVGFIAGKKLGSAPLRSRCKRVLREMVRQGGYAWPNKDVIFVARAQISNASPLYLQAEYVKALKKADLLEATA